MRTSIAIFLLLLTASSCAVFNLNTNSPSIPSAPSAASETSPVRNSATSQDIGGSMHYFEDWTDQCIDKKGLIISVPLNIESWSEGQAKDITEHVTLRWKDNEGNTYERIEQKQSSGSIFSEWYITDAQGSMSKIQEKDIQTLKNCRKNQPYFTTSKRLLAVGGNFHSTSKKHH